MAPDVTISTDRSLLDVPLIERMLQASYWAAGRPRDVIERSIANSICFGAYTAGQQVAFARVITDRAVFAYLSDVFVVPEFRGHGVGKVLVAAILKHEDLQGVQLFLLRTRDAHGLYAPFGFEPVKNPEELMARSDLRPTSFV
jgi:GNAT superfamily N-acetyltransferase